MCAPLRIRADPSHREVPQLHSLHAHAATQRHVRHAHLEHAVKIHIQQVDRHSLRFVDRDAPCLRFTPSLRPNQLQRQLRSTSHRLVSQLDNELLPFNRLQNLASGGEEADDRNLLLGLDLTTIFNSYFSVLCKGIHDAATPVHQTAFDGQVLQKHDLCAFFEQKDAWCLAVLLELLQVDIAAFINRAVGNGVGRRQTRERLRVVLVHTLVESEESRHESWRETQLGGNDHP